MQKKITVIGAGSWGTGLAQHLAKNSHQVSLRVNDKKKFQEINESRKNFHHLPEVALHQNIELSLELQEDSDFVFIVVASKNLPTVFLEISTKNFKKSCCFVICSKGLIAAPKPSLISDYFEEITGLKNHVSLLGPNFANEVADGLPTFTSIASPNYDLAVSVIKILNSQNFLAIYQSDQKTAEISGAIKNVMAIGCGMVEGLSLGQNCKAALILRGIFEIQALCKAIGASSELANPAGFGDIFLTCSSLKSRNYSLGLAVVDGKNPLTAEKYDHQTYEGAVAAQLIIDFAKLHKIELPLCFAIFQALYQNLSKAEIKSLLISAIFQSQN